MNILAVRSPSIINNLSTAISPSLPIGLAYVLGAIKDLANIQAIDPIAENPDISNLIPFKNNTSIIGIHPQQIADLIKIKPDICIISSMFSMEWPITQLLVNLVRKKFPNAIIIGGGEHFSALPEYSLLNSGLDICIVGEGEETIRETVLYIKDNEKIPVDIKGTVIKNKGNKIIFNERRENIKDIDYINYPAWEYFDVNKFIDKGISNSSNSRYNQKDHRPFLITATRGCPYKCTFCSNSSMWIGGWRARKPALIIKEMKHWINKYNITHFDFCDLTTLVNRNWIMEFCDVFIKEKLDITWGIPSGTRSEVLDYEVLSWLKKAGCYDLDYAPENGSEYILQIMNKHINKNNMLKSVKNCYKVGINSKANIIFGYPEERRRDIFTTFKFISRLAIGGLNDILIVPLTVYPGSLLFDKLRKENKLAINENYFLDLASQGSLNIAPCYSEFYSKYELQFYKIFGFIYFYFISFLFHPKRLFILIRDLFTGTGTSRLSMGLINIMRRKKIIKSRE